MGFPASEDILSVLFGLSFPSCSMNYCSTESGDDDESTENEEDKRASTAEVVESLNRQGVV